MLSECARVNTAAEYRYRISAPNSRPRAVLVVALDRASEDVVARLSPAARGSAVFRSAVLDGRPIDLAEQIERADLVVMVTTVGAAASAAAMIGMLCRSSRVTTTTLVLGDADVPTEVLSRSLAQLRPYSTMLVSTSTTDYIADLLAALRA